MKADSYIVTYARTLLEVAEERGKLGDVREEVEFFIQMSKDEKVYREERDSLKTLLEDLEEQLKDATLGSRQKDQIRKEIASLNSTLQRFDSED